MNRWNLVGAAILSLSSLAGGSWAAEPSKADMDFCNQKAAQASKPSPVQPGVATTQQPSPPPTTGRQADSNKPGTPVSPGTSSQPAPGTGGRITDATQPSEMGMAPIGKTDPDYRATYLACINERTK
jgi:hypothetical protein